MNLVADLSSRRLVNPSNLLFGLRQLELTEGVFYSGTLSLVSGTSLIFGEVSNLQITVAEPKEESVPVLQFSRANGAAFNFTASSVALDYAMRNSTSKDFKTDVRFDFSGVTYSLSSVPTPIINNPSVNASTGGAFYPLNGNPSGFVGSGALGQMFTFTLPSGADAVFVPFPTSFVTTPVVTYTLDLPPNANGLYGMATSGVNRSGFGVFLTAPLEQTGYYLSIFAR